MLAAELIIQKIPHSALKHYWSAALDDLKQSSCEAHKMLEYVGRPRSGLVFNIMKHAKYIYKYIDKLEIKDAVNFFENKFSDELYDCLMSKDLHKFCKTLKRKCYDNVVNINSIDGNTEDLTVADILKQKFNISSSNSSNETSDTPALHGAVSWDR